MALVGFFADLVFVETTAAFAKSPREGFVLLTFTFFLGLPDPPSAHRHLFTPLK
jgi:hypothetical protein